MADDEDPASGGPTADAAGGGSATGTRSDREEADPDPVELGVELLSKLEHPELSVAEAVDRIETVTTHPATTRKILDEAEKRGVIEREDGVVRTTGGGYVSFQSEVVTKEGEFSCRRCGASISTGYFIELDAGEHGAFGPECIRKVTGRD
ncbi:DUF5830 family protein [Halorussus sp. AFM4]|uniref:DUF5830 family protein n=1 Tax=Halorussus sp. AFM4 TaxID=3421651 RepID=UPI003EBDDE5E